jgi:hypothetical protein
MQNKFGVVLGVIAVVLAIVALIGPWWVVNADIHLGGGFTSTSQQLYSPFGRTETSQSNVSSSTNASTYSDMPQTGSVFTIGTALTALGLVLGIAMVVIGALPSRSASFRRFAMIAGVLAFLFLLIAPLYVMSALPAAVNQDMGGSLGATSFSGFWGTKSASLGLLGSVSITWAAGWAWYVAIVAGIVALVGGIAMMASRKPAMPAPQMAPPP